jgi:hypothetical protein
MLLCGVLCYFSFLFIFGLNSFLSTLFENIPNLCSSHCSYQNEKGRILECDMSGKVLDLYSEGALFDSRPRYRYLEGVFREFPYNLKKYAGRRPQLDHVHFLQSSFQFTIHLSSNLSTLYSLDTNNYVHFIFQKKK